MAYKQFGNTWWGNAWLNALSHIDFSNRLPRGKRYARNGSVLSIKFQKKEIVAKVKGSWADHYIIRISKKKFSKKQEEKIISLIQDNPFYLSQLSANKLPHQLLNELEEHKINLFPISWSDISAKCSCPDWAVPCKHIAAVFYIIANEIDQNPFLVFDFHNFDLLDKISEFIDLGKKTQDGSQKIISIKDTFKKGITVKPVKELFEKFRKINLFAIENNQDDILKILPKNPLFMPEKNFHSELKKMYKYCQREIKKILKDKDISKKIKPSKIKKIRFDLTEKKFAVKLENNNQSLRDFYDLVSYFNQFYFDDLEEADNSMILFWFMISFAFHIIKTSSFVPQILNISKTQYRIRWIPANFKKEVSNIFNLIAAEIPPKFVQIKFKNKKYELTGKEALNYFISNLIEFFLNEFYLKYQSRMKSKIDSFFFYDLIFKAKKFEEKLIPQTISLWISKFYITADEIKPVIKIDESKTNNEFYLDIFVVTKDKLSNLIPLIKIFKFKKYEKIRFQILQHLSHLSDFLPVVNDYLALKAEKPISINSDDFVEVWFNSLPLLEILNIQTIIPKSLNKIISPQVSLASKPLKKMGNIKTFLELKKMLCFDWQIAIGDNFIEPDEFFRQVNDLSGIVKIADQYVFVDKKKIRKLYSATQKNIPDFSSTEILRLAISEEYKGVKINLQKKVKDIFKHILTVEKEKIPQTLNAVLRDYQIRGFQWLKHNSKIGFGSIIADDMGLGKTIQIITLLLKEKEQNKLKNPALIIVPTTLLTNWKKEFSKFAPSLNIEIYHGSKRKLNITSDVILTSYGLARNDNKIFKTNKWHSIIIDEAQNIKNHQTKQTRAIKKINANYKIAMTGTPVENRLSEYWSIMDFLNKGLLGTPAFFRKEYAIPIEKERNGNKLDQFLKITSPFILRREKTDKTIIKDLPEKFVFNQYCSLTKEQAALYQNVIDKSIEDLDEDASGIARKGRIFKLMIALKQICNHPVNYLKTGKRVAENSGKTKLLLTLLEKIISNKEKCLIFTQYTEMGRILKEILGEYFDMEILYLHGALSRKKREEMIEKFQNNHHNKIFILSLKAGGTGLNLTKANHVIHYDLWWNPAVEKQATDRAYRIGQNKNVNVHRFITTGTFEEKINEMIESKNELFELSVKKGEKWISEMSNKEITDLIKLSKS